jgi:ABC-type lipoprotein export system ATPase subunit
MNFTTKKINNIEIINPLSDEIKPILHEEIINIKYPQIIIVAKKGSGKSTTIYNMLKYLALIKSPGCNIYIFASTVHSDPVYLKIKKKYGEYKNVNICLYHDFIIDGVNVLNEILDNLNNINDEEKPRNENKS